MSHSLDQATLSAKEVLQRYFIENRSRLLDLAAYLDRIQRAEGAEAAFQDSKVQCLLKGISELLRSTPHSGLEARGDRTERIQLILSDPDCTPLDGSKLEKSASGAPKIPSNCC